MKDQRDRIITTDRLGDAVVWLGSLFHKRPKQPVPDNKCGTVVFVQIMLITAVVHTVMGRSGENVFNRCRKLFDIFCMKPKLVQYCDLMTHEECKRIEAYHDHWNKENEFDMLGPA